MYRVAWHINGFVSYSSEVFNTINEARAHGAKWASVKFEIVEV